MAEETTQESVTETPPTPEPVIEIPPTPEPIPEPVAEPQISEPTPTAQQVEPLDPEPISEPQQAPEPLPEPSTPAPEPIQAPEPVVEPAPQPESVSAPEHQVIAPVSLVSRAKELLVKAREAIQFRRRKKLEKIMGLFLKKSPITNDDVQKLVYVSDATATRYLQQLEKEGKVRRQGVPGHASYSRI